MCLTPLSTIFQFNCCRKVFVTITTNLSQVTDKRYNKMLYRVYFNSVECWYIFNLHIFDLLPFSRQLISHLWFEAVYSTLFPSSNVKRSLHMEYLCFQNSVLVYIEVSNSKTICNINPWEFDKSFTSYVVESWKLKVLNEYRNLCTKILT